MIAFLQGVVLHSDESEMILLTRNGIGHKTFCFSRPRPGLQVSYFITQIIRENTSDLYAHQDFREKKFFEMLLKVKGVGPKSAYALLSAMGTEALVKAICLENKKIITQTPGIGPKAASQILLDLGQKSQQVYQYPLLTASKFGVDHVDMPGIDSSQLEMGLESDEESSLTNGLGPFNEAVMACKELGISEAHSVPLIQKILAERGPQSAEGLVALALKGLNR